MQFVSATNRAQPLEKAQLYTTPAMSQELYRSAALSVLLLSHLCFVSIFLPQSWLLKVQMGTKKQFSDYVFFPSPYKLTH